MPGFQPGELVAVMSAGAYGFSMSSNYNARPRVRRNLGAGSGFLCYQKTGDLPPAYLGGVYPGIFEIVGAHLASP